MGTILSLILGVVTTVIVSHYYWKRSVNKSIGVYGLLNSYVFAGIDTDVRRRLHFRFHDQEVRELQQVVFLVANDGEKAVRDILEPLSLTIPADVAVLDASIIHRWPDVLKAELRSTQKPSGGVDLCLDFPLLNKGEFFVVKLLLSGNLQVEAITFSLLGEDLPRSLRVQPAPPAAVQEAPYKFDWALGGSAAFFLLFMLWICRWLYVLRQSRPELFPLPLSSFRVSMESLFLVVPGVLFVSILALLGIGMAVGASFGGEFTRRGRHRFPLPKEIREAVFPYAVGLDRAQKSQGWPEPTKETRPMPPAELDIMGAKNRAPTQPEK